MSNLTRKAVLRARMAEAAARTVTKEIVEPDDRITG